jgi:flagellar P-ring protein precursor FlgI
MSEPSARIVGENSARMPSGGLLEMPLPAPPFGQDAHLLLREPDLTMASRIATAVNREIGDGTATVEDPGSILLKLKTDKGEDHAALMARIGDLRVQPSRNARLVIDARSGAIVVGGDITVGEASVSQGPMTLTIGAQDTTAVTAGQVRVTIGTPVNKIAEALRAVKTPPAQIAAIFESLRAAGAITAEIIVR